MKSILELMIMAERRDTPWAAIVLGTKPRGGNACDTVVSQVTHCVETEAEYFGEIDHTDDRHYLEGPNYNERIDDFMEVM